jgi:hypothetical protein
MNTFLIRTSNFSVVANVSRVRRDRNDHAKSKPTSRLNRKIQTKSTDQLYSRHACYVHLLVEKLEKVKKDIRMH